MKNFFLYSLLLLITSSFYAQAPSINWQKCLGGTGSDGAGDVRQTSDGGYIVVGQTYSNDGLVSNNRGGSDCWLVKLNSTGTVQWQKTFGGSEFDSASSVRQTSDGGFIVIGNTSSNNFDVSGNTGETDAWVVKLSNLGVIEWQKTIGGSGTDFETSIEQTTDGGYILSGYANSTDGIFTSGAGCFIIKLNSTGVIQWQKMISTVGSFMNRVKQTSDGGFIAAGFLNVSSTNTDYQIVKLNSLGTIEWQKYYGGSSFDFANDIQQTTDGGFIVTGYTSSTDNNVTQNNGLDDAWILKLNNLGDLQWQKCFGGSDKEDAVSIQQTIDGGYVACGYTKSNDGMVTGYQGADDFWILKISNVGNLLWQKTLGGNNRDRASCIRQTTDNGFIVAGLTRTQNNGDVTNLYGTQDFWLVKLSPDNLKVNDFSSLNDLKIYPNPVKDLLYFNSENKIISFEVYDITGRILNSNKVIGNSVDLSNLKTGNYLLKLYTNDSVINSKIIKE